jgi:hypothetical protein
VGQPRVTGADEITSLKKDGSLRIISLSRKTKSVNIKTHEKTKHDRLLRILLFFSILINLPSPVFSQAPDPLLQKLDSHFYYPSQLGLNKLTAKIQWLEKDLSASQPKFISHPEVLFSWNAKHDARVFQVVTDRKELSQTHKEEVENFFQNYKEVILPRRLAQTLSGFKHNRSSKAFFKTTVEYQSPYTHDEIQTYSLDINSEYWRISQITIARKNPPYNVISKFKYIQKEGKWLVSETLARFNLGKNSFFEKTSYTYQRIQGFWLPVKINQIFKKGNTTLHNYRFLVREHQIN